MPPRRLTRRQAVQLGAGAAALAALPLPSAASACDDSTFEMPLELGDFRARMAGAWQELPPMRARHRFHLLGVRWRHARAARVQVRTRRRGGAWTRWTELHAHGDHGPDGARKPAGTDPAWSGAADFVQVRLQGELRGARLRFVRAEGRPRARAAHSRQAAAPPGAPAIITRAEWGGDGCRPRAAPDYGTVQLAFVHHTVTMNDYTAEESPEIVRTICRYHRDTLGWNDLGYNFLVDQYGQVFEGRAGGIDQPVVGAQAQGYNSVSTGVACIGDFRTVAQSEAGLEALARLLGWKLSLHGAPAQGQVTVTSAGGPSNRYPAGRPVTLERISGHRDAGKTACPGDALYDQLAVLRERAAAHAGPVSTLTVRLDERRVRHGSRVIVGGELRFPDGAAADAPIEVQHAPRDATTWTTLSTTRTAADGTWSLSLVPPASGRLRARFPGNAAHPPLEASPRTITVLPRFTLEVPGRAEAGTAVDVQGTLEPTWPSRIRLTFERRAGRRWLRVQRKRINVRGGRFSSYVRPSQPGVYRVRVKAPGARAARRLRAVPFTGGAAAH